MRIDLYPQYLREWAEENFPEFESGDIFATRGTGIIGWLSRNLFSPRTDRFHFGLLWHKVNNDWIILESIGRGISVGRLSFYKGKDIKYYRANCPYGMRRKICSALTKLGRSNYDYGLIVKIVLGSIWAFLKILFTEHKFRKLSVEDLPYALNNAFICTELADVGHLAVGYPITNPENVPLPCAFEQARLEGRIREL